jgi:hypothetical protein
MQDYLSVDEPDYLSICWDMKDITLTWAALEDLAVEAGHRPDTIRKWRERRRVPYRLRGEFIEAAKARYGVKMKFADFDRLAKAA